MSSNRNKELRFYVSEEEYQQIENNAKQLRMQVNPFVRRIGYNYCIIRTNEAEVLLHPREVSALIGALNTFILSVEDANMYQPKEITLIVELLNEIIRCTNLFLDAVVYNRTKSFKRADKETANMIAGIDWRQIPRANKESKRRTRSIRIKVNSEEYARIEHIATLHRLPVGVYLRYVALNPQIKTLSYPLLAELNHSIVNVYVKQILIISKQVQQSNNYRQNDVQELLKYMLTIAHKEHEFLKANIYRCPKLEPIEVTFKEAVSILEAPSLRKKYSINLDGYESDYLLFEN